jgi:ATP-dependent Clp protease ATP-binding subunit ClpA
MSPRKKKTTNQSPLLADIFQESETAAALKAAVIGQDHVAAEIIPFLDMFNASLAPEGRPAGVFLLLGPTGTGKTHTVETLAKIIHGSPRHILKIDCGEYQGDHEVAKLIGAPPGYLGHRETQPVLTQMKVNAVMSDRANLAIILFDEIEKASPAFHRILLGILDKGILRLGDNSSVNFERTLIFLTSNLGAEAMQKEIAGATGLGRFVDAPVTADPKRHALSAAARNFSPEFINRLDRQIVYNFLTQGDMCDILDLEIAALARHIDNRLGSFAPDSISVTEEAATILLNDGYEPRYGARHLKRAVTQRVLFPLAAAMRSRRDLSGKTLVVAAQDGKIHLAIEETAQAAGGAA